MMKSARQILTLAQDVRSFCLIFLDFIHPVWIQSKRSESVPDERLDELKGKAVEKLVKVGNELVKEFDQLTNQSTVID
jgi:hypothetical protein